jgi:hypothetical protein
MRGHKSETRESRRVSKAKTPRYLPHFCDPQGQQVGVSRAPARLLPGDAFHGAFERLLKNTSKL